jgi:transcription initiation factor IIE alpha subunit
LAETGVDELGDMSYSCAESSEKLIALYESGRNLIVRCRTSTSNWNIFKHYIWCETREEIVGGGISLAFKEIDTYDDDPLPEKFALWVRSDKVYVEPYEGKDYDG